jgi:hypothetical protein
MEVKPIKELLLIPEGDLPLMAFSDDVRGFMSWGIKEHQEGWYNHFMWLTKPGIFVSQDFPLLHEVLARKYMKQHRIKLWHNPDWTEEQKALLLASINADLELPWYNKMYDVVQIMGFLFKCRWLQIPGKVRICSDHCDHLSVIHRNWKTGLRRSPPELNKWFNKDRRFQVYGRYSSEY